MTAMEQEIIKPDTPPPTAHQAFSPFGCFIAASGATLLMLCLAGSGALTTVWAFSKLLGLPDLLMYAFMALSMIPVIWLTIWTAGRSWHVERLLVGNRDVDQPVYSLWHYLRKS